MSIHSDRRSETRWAGIARLESHPPSGNELTRCTARRDTEIVKLSFVEQSMYISRFRTISVETRYFFQESTRYFFQESKVLMCIAIPFS